VSILNENPVARHVGRWGSRRRLAGIGAAFSVAGLLGAALQRYWLELDDYSLLRPGIGTRWWGFVLLALTLTVLPWSAACGAFAWRRLRVEGHLDEYLRSRMPVGAIVGGALAAALRGPVSLVLTSMVAAALVGLLPGVLPLSGVIPGHLLLICEAAAFCAMGLWLADRVRFPGLAVALAATLLACCLLAILWVEPLYGRVGRPETWSYLALLPNPLTAMGSVLETDVLRMSWLYSRLHAHEFFYVYPPAWQTGGIFIASALLALIGLARRVSSEP
jgi:hypothetical protein